jgi:phosphohistidine phosphatase
VPAPPAGVLTRAMPRAGVRSSPMWPTMVVMERTRRLIVMRHAKAGELPGGPDFERALKTRGRSDSAAAGEWLRSVGYRPDSVICSAARQTWQLLFEVLGTGPQFAAEKRLYQAAAADLLEIISETPAEVTTLMYIGHNPEAAKLVAGLTGTEPHFPTSAIAGYQRARCLG